MLRLRAVIAMLACLGLVGGHAASIRWVRLTSHAEWSPGYSFSVVGLRDTLWILGHREGNWYSADGVRWWKDTLGAVPSSRHNSYVALDGAIYAIGGADNQTHPVSRAVWKSIDGRRWQLLTDHPPWSARVWHTAVVHDHRIWLIGGFDGEYKNDVWSTADGVSWRLATPHAAWTGRCMHAAVDFDGELWVLGGRRNIERWWEIDFNDVWRSSDGVTWTRATGRADWSKRYGVAAVAWNEQLWVMGGSRLRRSNDVWSSRDGVAWTSRGHAGWSPRFSLASTVFRDRVWVLGGKEGGGVFTNDVWLLDTLTR